MITETIDGATVSVEYEGVDRDEYGTVRRRYRYVITTDTWQYVDNDLSSGHAADVDEADMLRSLCGFLAACAESRQYVTRNGGTGENAHLFPDHVGAWAESISDELSILSLDPDDTE